MKLLVTATVDAPSVGQIKETRRDILGALELVKDRSTNGSQIKIGSCNAENPAAVQMLMGQIKWFTLGREADGFSEHKRQASKKRRAGIVEPSIDEMFLDL